MFEGINSTRDVADISNVSLKYGPKSCWEISLKIYIHTFPGLHSNVSCVSDSGP